MSESSEVDGGSSLTPTSQDVMEWDDVSPAPSPMAETTSFGALPTWKCPISTVMCLRRLLRRIAAWKTRRQRLLERRPAWKTPRQRLLEKRSTPPWPTARSLCRQSISQHQRLLSPRPLPSAGRWRWWSHRRPPSLTLEPRKFQSSARCQFLLARLRRQPPLRPLPPRPFRQRARGKRL